jgi:hypothetical protein
MFFGREMNLMSNKRGGTAIIALLVIAVIAAVGAGAYFVFVHDDPTDDGTGTDDGITIIQGTVGIGTTFEYTSRTDGISGGDVIATIIGQNESHYLLFFEGTYESYYVLMHKITGDIDFAENKGASDYREGTKKWEFVAEGTDASGYIPDPETPGLPASDIFMTQIITVESGILNDDPAVFRLTCYYSYPTPSSNMTIEYTLKENSMVKEDPAEYEHSPELWKWYKYDWIRKNDETEQRMDTIINTIANDSEKLFYLTEMSWEDMGIKLTSKIFSDESMIDYYDLEEYTKTTVIMNTIDGNIAVDKYARTSGDYVDEIYIGNNILYKTVNITYYPSSEHTNDNISYSDIMELKEKGRY